MTDRNSDTGRSKDFTPVDAEWLEQILLQPFRRMRRIGNVVDVIEDDGKFIAAQTRHHIAGTQAGFQPPRNADQQLVADVMTETVVDDLETVEVQKERGEQVFLTVPGAA